MPKLSKHFHPLSRIPKYPNKLHASAWKERQKLSSDSKAFPLATHSAPLSNINSDISVTWRASLRQEDEGRTGWEIVPLSKLLAVAGKIYQTENQ
jgi:hypothetical protein